MRPKNLPQIGRPSGSNPNETTPELKALPRSPSSALFNPLFRGGFPKIDYRKQLAPLFYPLLEDLALTCLFLGPSPSFPLPPINRCVEHVRYRKGKDLASEALASENKQNKQQNNMNKNTENNYPPPPKKKKEREKTTGKWSNQKQHKDKSSPRRAEERGPRRAPGLRGLGAGSLRFGLGRSLTHREGDGGTGDV